MGGNKRSSVIETVRKLEAEKENGNETARYIHTYIERETEIVTNLIIVAGNRRRQSVRR